LQKLHTNIIATFLLHYAQEKPKHILLQKKAKHIFSDMIHMKICENKKWVFYTQKQLDHSDHPKSKFPKWLAKPQRASFYSDH